MERLRFNFHRLYRFSNTRIGRNQLGVDASLIALAASIAFCVSVFNHARDITRQSNQDEANGRAICEALGFNYTGLYDKVGDTYVDRGTGLLRVKPDGPFDRAGLKEDDRILLNLGTVKTLFIQRRGKTVVLPVQRGEQRQFTVTVTVPRFAVPYPERVPSTPVAPGL